MELMVSDDLPHWNKSLAIYKEVVALLSQEKRKRKKGKFDERDTLSYLDQWYQEELPVTVKSRDPPHLVQEELCQLMKWKLTRGKFRPKLTDLVKENDPTSVIEITTEAYSQVPNIRKAIETLNKLKGIGPATASAILCLVHPQHTPFMSDESTLSIPNIGKLDYSLKQYLMYAETLKEKAEGLGKGWTAHQVELALWSYHFANQLKPDLLLNGDEPKEEEDKRNDSDDAMMPPVKKIKS